MVTVEAGAAEEVVISVDAEKLVAAEQTGGLQLVWSFNTEANDVDFSVSLRNDATDQGLLPSARHDASEADAKGCLPLAAAGDCPTPPHPFHPPGLPVVSSPHEDSVVRALSESCCCFAALSDVITFGNTFSWMNSKARQPNTIHPTQLNQLQLLLHYDD